MIRRPSPIASRDRAEAVGHEDAVGDALRQLAAAAAGDREPRALHRRDVVNAVADHGNVARRVAQRLHQAPLVLWARAARTRCARGRRAAASSRSSSGSSSPSTAPAPTSIPPAGDRGNGHGRVTRHHLERHPLVRAGTRSCRAGVVAQPLGQHHGGQRPQRGRLDGRAGRLGRSHGVRAAEQQHTAALLLVLADHAGHGAGGQHVGRAQHQPAFGAAQPHSAPLPARRERHLVQHLGRLALNAVGDRVQRLVAPGGTRGIGAQLRAHVGLGHPVQRDHRRQGQAAVGERAGLVHADRVHVGQRLHRVQVLHEHAASRQARRRPRRTPGWRAAPGPPAPA